MSDEIKLELDPKVPTLDLDVATPSAVSVPNIEDVTALQTGEAPAYLSDANLSDAEKQMVEDFSTKINLRDSNVILQYGAAAQQKIADFSDNALEGVKTKDLGEIGKEISSLITELKGFDVDDAGKATGLAKWFKKKANSLTTLKAKYDTVEKNVDRIAGTLQDHQNTLLTDIVMLDKMYETNLTYFKELTMYIIAGKKKLEEERATTLVELQQKAKESGLAEDAQTANDFAALCDRFEKKLYDLELTRTVSMQMAPQIRMIQNNDTLMTEKIQSTVNNTIPLWKNQMVLALTMAHADEAMQAQQEVNEFTNKLIAENAEKIHQGTVEIAKESEKGIVEIETVVYANNQLIDSLDEVVKIQEEGRAKRLAAENELGLIEAQLKQKLLDIRNSTLEN
ncbi:MAG: toxic anion resistance protein [Lachnospiraceae bacterium]|nr:toxic anion resistance protein [Lachnospiraceae bacterium]MBR3361253.1 toxic anion resistance protein [Lachnospiraceae bacterium]MBR6357405.1 toxic anion resistance protein [Lachnospiraceae bacterium]